MPYSIEEVLYTIKDIRRIIFDREILNDRCNEVYGKYMKAICPSAQKSADWWDLTTDDKMIGFDRVVYDDYGYNGIRDEEVGRFPASWLELTDDALNKTLEEILTQKRAKEAEQKAKEAESVREHELAELKRLKEKYEKEN
jgi:hypothetical protein